jgi:hypothetical protein
MQQRMRHVMELNLKMWNTSCNHLVYMWCASSSSKTVVVFCIHQEMYFNYSDILAVVPISPETWAS